MSQLTPNPKDYYDYLRSSEDNGGKKPKQSDFAMTGCSINKFGQMVKDCEEPTRGVHEAWCELLKGKARHLNELYHRIWGSDDPDESIEETTVFSGVTAELLQVECQQVRRRKSGVSMLDRRFALEQLATLSEIEKDWGAAHQLLGEMLGLQHEIGDPIYLCRAYVRKAYITYKLARTSGGASATMDDAESELNHAATEWTRLCGADWKKNHPDIKALVKWLEIRALILCTKGRFQEAIESIKEARKLRARFSGKAGKASGAYREGVVYSQAVSADPKNADRARRAFEESIDLRKQLDLPRDAGIAAERWAQFERTEFEAGRTGSNRWLDALETAFRCFGESNDPVRQLGVALAIVEHDEESFWKKGQELMIASVPRAFDAAFRRGQWDAFRVHLDRPGWKKWVCRHSTAHVLLHRVLARLAPVSEKRKLKNVWHERAGDIRKAFQWLPNAS